MIQLIVVIASILLGMIIYPILINKYRNFISNQYQKMSKEQTVAKNNQQPAEDKIVPSKEEIPSFVGKSKTNLRQSEPNTATDLETEKAIEKAPIFVPSKDSDPEMIDIEVPLEKVESLPEEEFNAEDEAEELEGLGPDAVLASGVDFDDLIKTQQVIESPTATLQEEKDAGRVIYQSQKTDMFEQLASSGDSRITLRISSLLDIHLKELAKEQQSEKELSLTQNKQLDSQDFKDFDVNNIF